MKIYNIPQKTSNSKITIMKSNREVMPEFEEKNKIIAYIDENYTFGVISWISYFVGLYTSFFQVAAKSSYYPSVLVSYVLDLFYSAVMLVVRLLWTLGLAVLLPFIVGVYLYAILYTIIMSIYENFLEFRLVRWTIALLSLLFDGIYYIYALLSCRQRRRQQVINR